MPTETRPNAQKWNSDYKEVRLSQADLNVLYGDVHIDPAVQSEEAEQFAKDIEALINRRAYLLAVRLGKSLPAHVVAALEPIQKHAAQLAALLHPGTLPLEVQHALNMMEIDDGDAWHLLTRIDLESQAAIEFLKTHSGSEQHNRVYSQEMVLAKESFSEFFEQQRHPPEMPPSQKKVPSKKLSTQQQEYEADKREYGADKLEFLEVCCKYLPKPTAVANEEPPP